MAASERRLTTLGFSLQFDAFLNLTREPQNHGKIEESIGVFGIGGQPFDENTSDWVKVFAERNGARDSAHSQDVTGRHRGQGLFKHFGFLAVRGARPKLVQSAALPLMNR